MNAERAQELVSKFDKQVLVIGDVMLDRFVRGSVNRFSPEAPSCPVLEQASEVRMLGGAGNAAANLVSLGAKCVRLVGLIGHDSDGQELRWVLSKETEGIDDKLVRTLRPTAVKTRFVSQDDRHLLRCDNENTEPVSEQDQKFLLNKVRDMARICDGIVIDDYDKGVITRDTIRAVMDIARAANDTPVFVDPKKNHWEHFQGAEVVKPNLDEAYAAMGKKAGGCSECGLEELGEQLLHYTRAKAVIITRAKDGMSLFDGTGIAWAEPKPIEVVDVSGAGDTTMATLTLARLAGASWVEAMELANNAAGIAVGKSGTSTVSAEELMSSFLED